MLHNFIMIAQGKN